MGVHYASDILAGAILGILVGWAGWELAPALLAWLTGLLPALIH